MLPDIPTILRQFRHCPTVALDDQALTTICREEGLSWRESKLNPIVTIKLFLLQILHANTAMTHLRQLAGMSFTASAYCQARQRIPLAVFQRLLKLVCESFTDSDSLPAQRLWQGRRLFFADGGSCSMPDTPALQSEFGQPGGQKPGCGFPVMHLMTLVDAGSGLIRQMLSAPLRVHDASQLIALHPELRQGDVLVADRGLCSYAHLAMAHQRGVDSVCRMHQRQIVDFTPQRPHAAACPRVKGLPQSRWIRALGKLDQVVVWIKPKSRPKWMTPEQFAALPDELAVRELRYEVECAGFRTRQITLVTTLLSSEDFPASALVTVYFRRWRIEGCFAELKVTLGMDVLKSHTVEGIYKELAMFALVYNLVRQVAFEAAQRQGVELERISFIDALRWLTAAQPHSELITLIVNPHRPNRYEPRVRKRRSKQFGLLNKPRQVLREALKKPKQTALRA